MHTPCNLASLKATGIWRKSIKASIHVQSSKLLMCLYNVMNQIDKAATDKATTDQSASTDNADNAETEESVTAQSCNQRTSIQLMGMTIESLFYIHSLTHPLYLSINHHIVDANAESLDIFEESIHERLLDEISTHTTYFHCLIHCLIHSCNQTNDQES